MILSHVVSSCSTQLRLFYVMVKRIPAHQGILVKLLFITWLASCFLLLSFCPKQWPRSKSAERDSISWEEAKHCACNLTHSVCIHTCMNTYIFQISYANQFIPLYLSMCVYIYTHTYACIYLQTYMSYYLNINKCPFRATEKHLCICVRDQINICVNREINQGMVCYCITYINKLHHSLPLIRFKSSTKSVVFYVWLHNKLSPI